MKDRELLVRKRGSVEPYTVANTGGRSITTGRTTRHGSVTNGKPKQSSLSSSSSSMMHRVVKVSTFTAFSLLVLATPNDAVTKLARTSRPSAQTFTIDSSEYHKGVNDDGGSYLKIDVQQQHHQHQPVVLSNASIALRVLRRRRRQQKQRIQNSYTQQSAAAAAAARTKLSQLSQAFKEAFLAGNDQDCRHQHHQHQDHAMNRWNRHCRTVDNNSSVDKNTGQVHVGKMLSAMHEMEAHMRSVGMTQTANDLKSNLEKAKRLYRSAPAETRDSLPDLLRWEISTGIHGDRKSDAERLRVKNHSGAMGLFWIAHNVAYQNDLYRLMLDEGKTPLQAANAAFEHTLEPHMEWTMRKIARAAIPRMVPATQTEFFSALSGYDHTSYGPQEHETVRRDVHSILDVWEPMLDDWKKTFDQLQLTDI